VYNAGGAGMQLPAAELNPAWDPSARADPPASAGGQRAAAAAARGALRRCAALRRTHSRCSVAAMLARLTPSACGPAQPHARPPDSA